MIVRAYVERDRDAVIALWQSCGLVVPQNDPGRDIERKLSVARELFLVGEHAGQVVATVMGGYDGHRGWINYLAVAPGHRGSGYGRQIMLEVEARIQDMGCAKINLQIRSTNREVIAFYRAIGYAEDPVVSMGKRLEVDNSK